MVNRLIQETSPYLKQHAQNPVDWYPWGEEAFSAARGENKPIHLSIGYAACHWCHVMAHETFEDKEIAKLMNERFVNIKVDRQERPDLDDIYQKTVQMLGQGGGWPLTVFMTQRGEPFFAGTYFPPASRFGRPGFVDLIVALSEAWQSNPEVIKEMIEQFSQGYNAIEKQLSPEKKFENVEDIAVTSALFLAEHADKIAGGLGSAPKFPNASCFDLILRMTYRIESPLLLSSLELTLDSMARGGIYDQIGGGFARYSVDRFWRVPHFEKMLYDNGQLIKLYADAYRAKGKTSWRVIFEACIAYILREMMHPCGAFYASEDADTEGEEGKYYVWTLNDIKAILGEKEGTFACEAFGVTEKGNFESGKSVLNRELVLEKADEEHLKALSQKLLTARGLRVRPSRDENMITSWNALVIQGLCSAFQATGEANILHIAKRAADFIAENIYDQTHLYRVWNEGKAKIPGFLDDYAYFANALLDLYESCFEKKYLDMAQKLVAHLIDKFWDEGLYFTARDAEKLIVRTRNPQDNACPSGMSESVLAFLRLFTLTNNHFYQNCAETVFKQYRGAAMANPFAFAHLLAAMDFGNSPLQIIFAGEKNNYSELISYVHRSYLPARVLAFTEDLPNGQDRLPIGGKLTAYICQNQTCREPITSVEDFASFISGLS